MGPPEGAGEVDLYLEVIPGVPALAAGAALLGAPLMHDFAAISLSDLLTPWETIEKRLELAAQGDFVIVLYNPKSKKRDWQLGAVRDLLLQVQRPRHPGGHRLPGHARGAGGHRHHLEGPFGRIRWTCRPLSSWATPRPLPTALT